MDQRLASAAKIVDQLGAEHWAIIADWLQQLKANAGDATLDIAAAVPNSFDRFTCLVSGAAEAVGPLAHDVLEATGAAPSESDLLTRAQRKLRLKRLGTWLEATEAGFDAGWWTAQSKRIDDVRTIVPNSAAAELLWDWADDHGAQFCCWLRRAINPATPYTEVAVTFTEDATKRWASVEDASGILGMDSFPQAVAPLVEEAPAEKVALSVRLLEEGITRLAIVLLEPSPETVTRAADLVSLDTQIADELGNAVGGAIARLEIAQTNAGLQLDLRYDLTI